MVLAGIVLGASCSNSPTGPSIASVQVAPDSLHLIPGRDTVLVAVALDGAGHAVSGATFTFAASDTTVITVTSAGLVHSKNAGTTTVHVTSGNTIASVPVFVQKPFTITVTPSDTALTQGLAYNVTAIVYDSTLAVIPLAPVTFGSANNLVAQMSGIGHVSAVGIGVTTLTASCGTAVGHANVAVVDTSVVGHTTLLGSPFGTAATHSGVAYVLRHSFNQASRLNLPSAAAATTFSTGGNPTAVAFDSGGTTAYITDQAATLVQVVTVATNTITDSIPVKGNPFIVRVSPDDKSIWVSTNLDSLYQIDRSTKLVLAAYGLALVPNGLAFNPANDSMMYVSTTSVGTVVEINYKTKTVGRTFSPGGTTQGVAVSADGTTLYVANEGNDEVETYNLSSGTAGSTVSTPAGAFDLVLSGDGTKLWVTVPTAGVVEVINRSALTVAKIVKTTGVPRRIAVSGANPVVIANESGWVDLAH